jgi:hypothetical protein
MAVECQSGATQLARELAGVLAVRAASGPGIRLRYPIEVVRSSFYGHGTPRMASSHTKTRPATHKHSAAGPITGCERSRTIRYFQSILDMPPPAIATSALEAANRG